MQLVEMLRYKLGGRRFIFSLTYPSDCAIVLGLTLSLTNVYEAFFLGVASV